MAAAAAADILISQAVGHGQDNNIDAICLGSGRFLRSVLVPFLSSNLKPAVFQTRGHNFLDSFRSDNPHPPLCNDHDTTTSSSIRNYHVVVPSLHYPVDTVQFDGSVTTSDIEIYAAGTIGTSAGKSSLMDHLLLSTTMNDIAIIGVGVTEAGLQSADNQCMLDLTELLHNIFRRSMKCPNPNGKICVINTDNLPNNGDVVRGHVLKNAKKYDDDVIVGGTLCFIDFLSTKVAFLNSMVDRITSSRPGSDGLVPMCEPLPAKALVICDPGSDLPLWMDDASMKAQFGVIIRHDSSDLHADIALKLRVANGTHTAVAHALALLSLVNTESLCSPTPTSEIILSYLDSLYQTQIRPGCVYDGISASETDATWIDWRKRLQHPHFGLSTFFICQNGAAKCGIRLGPTIKSLINASLHGLTEPTGAHPLHVSMAFAVAVILRFLTPASSSNQNDQRWNERINDSSCRGVYVGWLDGGCVKSEMHDNKHTDNSSDTTVTYADGLRYNLSEGWYEFRCDCLVSWRELKKGSVEVTQDQINLPILLSRFCEPDQHFEVIRAYLHHGQGGNLPALPGGVDKAEESIRKQIFDTFVGAVSILYSRMVRGDSIIQLLQDMKETPYGFATPCCQMMLTANDGK